MCPACSAESARWLDARPPAVGGFSFGSGAAYDITPSGVTERRRARANSWWATVRFQRQLIREGCLAGRHAV